MKRVLITGAAGFVGRHFCKHFLDKKFEVVAVDNIQKFTGAINPKKKWPLFNPYDYKNFKFIKMDCVEWFNKNKNKEFDYVLHLAAIVGGREMIENNPLAVAQDLTIDSKFWEWCVTAKPKKTLYFSSSASYPLALQTKKSYRLLKESDINFSNNLGVPDYTYGWSKLTGEFLANIAYQKHGIKSVCYRPFSGYGEDQDINYPFPNLCKNLIMAEKNKFVQVWGDGKQMRDFIHIDDCVEGVIKTMDNVNNASPINLSTGIYTSFIDFIKLGKKITGYNFDIITKKSKPTGVYARGGSTQKQLKLGFKAQIKISDGIERGLKYFQK
ncbi:NAD-dependent epimerase/dehydratase family protein [Candidatus Pelagibacter ubique]|jgi:GDP-L-fucose synthase|nr:NAD-dependent epimerase/dehydratase family protein [Candidatus Pelagibacter ubique]